ncbi:hypothetical protein HDV57DRAFT_344192 [Trichoderma longibrachiatum]
MSNDTMSEFLLLLYVSCMPVAVIAPGWLLGAGSILLRASYLEVGSGVHRLPLVESLPRCISHWRSASSEYSVYLLTTWRHDHCTSSMSVNKSIKVCMRCSTLFVCLTASLSRRQSTTIGPLHLRAASRVSVRAQAQYLHANLTISPCQAMVLGELSRRSQTALFWRRLCE